MLGRDSSSCGHAGGVGGDPRERLPFFTSPSKSVCSSRSGQGCCSQVFHTIHKRPLSSAGSHSPTSQVWVCAGSTQGGHGHTYPTITTAKRTRNQGLVQPKTYHRHQVVLKTSEARSPGRYNIHRKAILTLSLQCPETAPARPCAGPLPSG